MNEVEVLELAQRTLLGEAADCIEQVAVFVWDEDRHYVAVNRAACDLVGRPREELLRMRVGDLTKDHASPMFEEVQRRGVATGSHAVDRADGPVEIEWVTCHTRVAGLPYLVSVCWRKPE